MQNSSEKNGYKWGKTPLFWTIHKIHSVQKMGDTFSQVYLQYVFAVQNRFNFIPHRKKEELHKYITGIVTENKCKMLAVNCMPDHTHLFVGFKPSLSISDLIKSVKVATNKFINQKKWRPGKFEWQEGYGVFSYGKSQIDRVIRYINNQEEHHRKHSFKQEYLGLLEKLRSLLRKIICLNFMIRVPPFAAD